MKEFIESGWREQTVEHQAKMRALTKEVRAIDKVYWQQLSRKQQAQGGRFPLRVGFKPSTAKRDPVGPGRPDSRSSIEKYFPSNSEFDISGEIRFSIMEEVTA